MDIYPNEKAIGDSFFRRSGPNRSRLPDFGQTQRARPACDPIRVAKISSTWASAGAHRDLWKSRSLFDGATWACTASRSPTRSWRGPSRKIGITGDLNITDIHRWDLMPPKGEGWTHQLPRRARHARPSSGSRNRTRPKRKPRRFRSSCGWPTIWLRRNGPPASRFTTFRRRR